MEKQENKELFVISINGARIQPAILTQNSKSSENYRQKSKKGNKYLILDFRK